MLGGRYVGVGGRRVALHRIGHIAELRVPGGHFSITAILQDGLGVAGD